jgi:biotin-dependent carboxylase-like uncharacterized protein
MGYLKIIEPGFLTTIQDGGRYGYRSFGMPVSGAMDIYSHAAGNLLTGNEPGESSLEITLTGPVIEFTSRTMIAVTGADLNPMINGQPVEMWCSHIVGRKDRLSFGSLRSGARAYLAVAGGFNVPEIMGSSSTYLRGRLGGLDGRKLNAGDRVPMNMSVLLFRKKKKMPADIIPEWSKNVILHVLRGIDFDEFPSSTIETFTSSDFRVTNYADRMGMRLSGPALQHKGDADVISYPLAIGTIQVPGDGNPVIMLADSQTVGGYTQIANIISADIWRTGQLKPGNEVRFRMVSPETALDMFREFVGVLYGSFGIRTTHYTRDNNRKMI